ncbi:unnamed protein product [Medioppia subpectinata]|uniref:Cyclin E n=1 Tax=Medioppia subpectinata TaxID=1979941 RepID=A0A7R9PZ66_9ACAR|nr:unnamed protein product [Medioppia subpectinata]CAG2106138.1 unnamed protein product [Medioppia subpectinata]
MNTSLSSMASLSIDSLTPNPHWRHSTRRSPLPTLSWADGGEVWDLMVRKDEVYQRNALMLHRHPTLQSRMRSILMDWLSEVCEVYRLNRDTYYLCIDFIDRYLSYQSDVPKQQLQLLGITCLFIAAKIEEIYPPKMSEFAYVTDGACEESEITCKELVILKALKWELCPMTANNWLTVYLQLYASHDKENTLLRRDGNAFLIPKYESTLFARIAHLVDLCILDIGSLTYSYSVIAASALYHFTHEDIVVQCTGIQMSELRECIVWMIPFALAIKDEGFDSPRFEHKLNEDSQPYHNIQYHNVDLQLLEKAYLKQTESQSDDSEESVSPISSPVAKRPRRPAILTPPKSSSKQSKRRRKSTRSSK